MRLYLNNSLWINDRSWQSQETFEFLSSFSIVINLEWFAFNSSSLKFLFFLLYILERIVSSWRIYIWRAWCTALKSAVFQEFIVHVEHASCKFCWISKCHSDRWNRWCQEIWTEFDSYKSERKLMHWWDQRTSWDTYINQILYEMLFFIHLLSIYKVCWTHSWYQA